MKCFILAAIVLSTSAYAQTTTCNSSGSMTTCNTPSAALDPAGQMLDSMNRQTEANIEAMHEQDLRRQSGREALAEGAAERRAAAYDRVGALIAAGKCEDAKRLARFYNHPDIIADTARACP